SSQVRAFREASVSHGVTTRRTVSSGSGGGQAVCSSSSISRRRAESTVHPPRTRAPGRGPNGGRHPLLRGYANSNYWREEKCATGWFRASTHEPRSHPDEKHDCIPRTADRTPNIIPSRAP